MTISTTASRVDYVGDDFSTAFAVPWPFFGPGELRVIRRTIATGAEAVLVLGTDYTVTGGNGATGTVTATTAPPSTVQWTILRNTNRTQEIDYQPNDPFPAETHERALDRIVAVVQDVERDQARAVRVPETDAGTVVLPSSVARAQKFLAFGVSGEPVAVTLDLGGNPVTPFAATLLGASDAAAARTTLEVLSRSDGLRYRNRIINPAMQISQARGSTLVDCTTGSTYAIDQWIGALSSSPGGTLRLQQVASATPGGSPFRLRATVQVADASIASGDVYSIAQPIEGQMIADARLGSAQARQLLVRFGVRSSVAGTFGVSVRNAATDRSWLGTITIGAGEVNTDLLRTLVIPGDAIGTWLTDTGIGLTLGLCLAAGATFQSSAGWQGGNVLTTSAQTNFMGTAGATFELFDVGLYVDTLGLSVFPPWELPPVNEDLFQIQRYYERGEARLKFDGAIGIASVGGWHTFLAGKRAAPAMNIVGSVSVNFTSPVLTEPNTNGFVLQAVPANNAVENRLLQVIYEANARF